MKINGETRIKEVYEWFFSAWLTEEEMKYARAPDGLTKAQVWSAALKQVAAYWEENPHLGTPTYVTIRADRVFEGPDKLRMEVEWVPLATSTSSSPEIEA